MKYYLKQFVVLTFLIIFTPYVLAEECQLDDKDKEVSCLRAKVKELKSDLKLILTKSQNFKDKQGASSEASKATSKQYEIVIGLKNDVIAANKEMIGLYKEDRELATKQIDRYRLCCLGNASNALRFHVGLGATGNDTEVAAMIGAGMGNFNIYGFLQDNNSGVMLGYQF